METRNVTLTLDKAREFYNSGDNALKEIALQAFTKDELTRFHYTDIKIFEDACKVLKLDLNRVYDNLDYISEIEGNLGKHLTAIYKLDIIRKALNGVDWNPRIAGGDNYYSFVRFYKEYEEIPPKKPIIGKFIAARYTYYLVGSCEAYMGWNGMGYFSSNYKYGESVPNMGLFGCRSHEIAEYMSRQFGKLIFEACYAQHIGAYKWVD